MTTPSFEQRAEERALQYSEFHDSKEGFLAGAQWGYTEGAREWKGKYIEARQSGFKEGREEMLEDVLKELRGMVGDKKHDPNYFEGECAQAAKWLEERIKL